MNDAARFAEAEALANTLAQQLNGHGLDIAAGALSLALAGVIAGYAPRDRDLVERQVTGLLHQRLHQLSAAALAHH